MPAAYQSHPGYSRVFRPGKLTFGFIMPLEGYPDSPFPTLKDHTWLAKLADDAGFSALWMRDVPFYDPGFGDTGQMLDPFVYLGYLAAHTRRIALGTAGIVLPLRDPLTIAKQAVSVDQLTGGRLILGLSSGDRPVEYPAFGVDFDNRADRFREAFDLVRTTIEDSFPTKSTQFYGQLSGNLDLVPKSVIGHVPMLVVGRARQDIGWIANNTQGWIWHLSDFGRLPNLLQEWRAARTDDSFRPYGYGSFFELTENPDDSLRYVGNRFRMGRNQLIAHWKQQEEQGVSHVALNLKPNRRPVEEILQELAEYVLPHFPGE
ncbi:LLM class oxidoreductase [Shinella daejeonensis]|nr:LLM class oxidoreductase [Shinella daejeonensis]